MSIVKSGSAVYKPLGKKGKGSISTQTGALSNQPYGLTRGLKMEREPTPRN